MDLKLEIRIFILLLILQAAFAQGTGIRDNSFLIEEGYNQERGMVQHILTHHTDWATREEAQAVTDFAFTQEWPIVGQWFQASFTLPFATQFKGGELHFRYQLMREPKSEYSVAPRLSLLLDYDSDLDLRNMLGYQFNLPISRELDRKRMIHANLGATFQPPPFGSSQYWSDGTVVYNAGASGIYAFAPIVHGMLEVLTYSGEDMAPYYIVNPGLRYAFNASLGTQWVFGTGIPIQFRSKIDTYGLFLYLSLEHSFLK